MKMIEYMGVCSTKDGLRENHRLLFCAQIGLLLMFGLHAAETACSSGVTELYAYSNPSSHSFEDSFEKYVTSDKGSTCRWSVQAFKSSHIVELSFKGFHLKQSDDGVTNDCLYIYDGENDEAELLDRLCKKKPKTKYTSTGRHLYLVYTRGKEEGKRSFQLEFVADSDMDKHEIIRIAIIIAASVSAFVFLYVVLRATKCCSCLRKKEEEDCQIDNNHERDLLTQTQVSNPQSDAETRVTVTSGASPQVPSANTMLEDADDVSLPSDTVSLHELNEPPPSYESLYLTEDGIAPPEYTPPLHKKSHPPRRVNTFN